jgi:hypothetical protein
MDGNHFYFFIFNFILFAIMVTHGIMYYLLYLLKYTLKWLGSYRKTSQYLVKIKAWIKMGFQLTHLTEVDIQKKYWQYSLLWLSLDFILLTPIPIKLVGEDPRFSITIGGILFILFLYGFIRKSTFEGIKNKINAVTNKLFWPTMFLIVGTFKFSSMKVSEINDHFYSHLPENTKLIFLNLTSGLFLVMTCALGLFLIIIQTIKYIVTVNFHASGLLCLGIKNMAGHCLKKEPEEPYKILELWIDPIKYLLTRIIWPLLGIYVLNYFRIHFM